ncbi:MAG: Crp/Fnr family transcriptional regulator [Pyrinomonadaceae bacterium]
MPSTRRDVPVENRLLAALPPKEYQRLLPELEHVVLEFGKILYEPGDTVRHVYFPNDSIISLLSTVAKRSTLEVGIVGNDGMAGISVFMGVDTSRTRALVQGPGTAARMRSAALRRESRQPGMLPRLLQRYSHSLLTQISQSAACNRFHTVDARLARWLLMTHDRVRSDEFPITQQFMSDMVGVRREGVNKAVGALQRSKLISSSRSSIRVLNRRGLESVSCVCYGIIRDEAILF